MLRQRIYYGSTIEIKISVHQWISASIWKKTVSLWTNSYIINMQ